MVMKYKLKYQPQKLRPSLSVKVKHEVFPQDPEESDGPALRRGTRNRVQRQLFSPTTKGPYHKAVGFTESGEESRSDDPHSETPILAGLTEKLESVLADERSGIGTDTANEHEDESSLIGNEYLLKTMRELESIRALRGVNPLGIKDVGVGHPPRDRVKKDPEKTMIDDMYQGVGYSTKKGFINIEVGQVARPLRQMNQEECKTHVVGLVLAQMRSLRKGTELFGEKAEQATMTERIGWWY